MDLAEHREYGGAGTRQVDAPTCGHLDTQEISQMLQPRWVPPLPEVGI